MKDLIRKQKIMLNRFLSWSDFGIEIEERRELENLIAKVRKETAETVCDRMIWKEKEQGGENYMGYFGVKGYNKRIKEEKLIKKDILKELL